MQICSFLALLLIVVFPFKNPFQNTLFQFQCFEHFCNFSRTGGLIREMNNANPRWIKLTKVFISVISMRVSLLMTKYSLILFKVLKCCTDKNERTDYRLLIGAHVIKLLIFIFFFLHFRVKYDFLTHLKKFQSVTNIRRIFFKTFFPEDLRPPLFDLQFWRLGCELEKVTSKAQKYLTCCNYNNNIKYQKSHEAQLQTFWCDFLYLLLW